MTATNPRGGRQGPQAALPDRSRSRAVLIGVSAFRHPTLPDVPAAGNSLHGMHDALVDLGGWPPERIEVLDNPSDCRKVGSLISDLAVDTDETLLLYYVGHGLIASTSAQSLCLAVADTDPAHPEKWGIEYSLIKEAFRGSPAAVKIAILDCCYSGRAIDALSGGGLSTLTEALGVYTLTACDTDQIARVPPLAEQDTACTTFTGAFLEVLHEGVPSQQDVLTLAAIYPEVRRRLLARDLPCPNKSATDTAEHLPFAVNRRRAGLSGAPAATPTAVKQLKGVGMMPSWLRDFAEPGIDRSTRLLSLDAAERGRTAGDGVSRRPRLEGEVDVRELAALFGLSRRDTARLARRPEIIQALGNRAVKDAEDLLRDLARQRVDLPFDLPLLWQPQRRAPAAALDETRLVDGFFIAVWRAELGRVCVLYRCDDLAPRALDYSAVLASLDARLLAVEAKKFELHGPRLLIVEAEAPEQTYYANWRDLAEVLGRDIPWWPRSMRRPAQMAQWEPDGSPAAYEPTTHRDVAALLDLADREPEGSPARLAAVSLAAQWHDEAFSAATDEIANALNAPQWKGWMLAARPLRHRAPHFIRRIPEAEVRRGWGQIACRTDHTAWACVQLASEMHGGGVFPFGDHIEIAASTGPAAEWASRLVPTEPTAVLAYLDGANAIDALKDPATGLPVAQRRNTTGAPAAMYSTLATQRLPTTSPLAQFIVDDVIWIRTQDGVLYPAPRLYGETLGFGYRGPEARRLAQLIERLLQDITAPAAALSDQSVSLGLLQGATGGWDDGEVLSRTQLLLAVQSTGRVDPAL
ncbi:hypothetical protein ABH935_005849 [Catenulispora sp. GAS73]|uniref:caspase, EACC1-associated type n=1 Tax=Catenulispora sp. GAS73 TaxID=3156269 RepID=UPI003519A941